MKNTKFYRAIVGGEWIKTATGDWLRPSFPKITRKLLSINKVKYKLEKYPHSLTTQANNCIGVH